MATTYFYYESGDKFTMLNCTTREITTSRKLPYGKNNHIFYALGDNYASHEGLKQFEKDFNKWCNEIYFVINYRRFISHQFAIEAIVKNHCDHYEDFEASDIIEALWLEKCNNSGLQKIFKKGELQCYGFDFKAFYLSLLGSCGSKKLSKLEIPTKRGKEITLTELDYYKLDIGMYHVKIQSTDPTFIFQYSADNVYTNLSLYQAFKCKNQGKKSNHGTSKRWKTKCIHIWKNRKKRNS
jgi:hypothetical protein